MKKINFINKAKLFALIGCMVLTPVSKKTIVNAEENPTEEIVVEETMSIDEEFSNENIDFSEFVETLAEVYGYQEESLYDYIDFRTNGYSELVDKDWTCTILRCAKDLYDESRKEGYYDSIATNEEYNVTLSPEQLVEKYAKIVGVNKYVAMAIAYTECAEPITEDWNYRTNGNIAGIGGDMHFRNAEAGVIYYMFMLRDDYGVKEDSDDSILSSMAHIYCPPNAYSWENDLARPIYNQIKDDFYARAPKDAKPNIYIVDYQKIK